MNLLDKNNQHIFLEDRKNENTSFIATINSIARDYVDIVEITKKFNEETISVFKDLVHQGLDVTVKEVAEDLKKGVYKGVRKLDINLLTNFAEYKEELSNDEKRALWNDPTKQVYYSSVTIRFNDYETITKVFSQVVNNHHKLYDELNSWTELKEKWGETTMDISPDTPIENHELLRLSDTTTTGSNIDFIALTVAPNGQNTAYDAVFMGAKDKNPSWTWMDTTSSLLIIANRINSIINTANYIKQVGIDFEDRITALQAQATESASRAAVSEYNADQTWLKMSQLQVTSNTLEPLTPPTVSYNANNNVISFGLPASTLALMDLSKFTINTINGHLQMTITEADVDSVVVNEETGKIEITLRDNNGA